VFPVRLFRKRDFVTVGVFVLFMFISVFCITLPFSHFTVDKRVLSETANPETLRSLVHELSEMDRHYASSDGLVQTADFIAKALSSFCPVVERQAFSTQYGSYENIVCIFNSEQTRTIVIGAHYDTFGNLPGADDNASGVAGLIELARMLQSSTPSDYRLELVAYSLEEPPFFRSTDMGSYHHAKKTLAEGRTVHSALILEMIGYTDTSPNSQSLPLSLLAPFYPDTGDFIAVVSRFSDLRETYDAKRHMQSVATYPVYSFNGPSFIPGVDFSDHLSYWSFDIPALMITDTSFYRNQNYHTEHDTPDTLNYDYMASIVNGVYAVVSSSSL
jgi:hypothetical protein